MKKIKSFELSVQSRKSITEILNRAVSHLKEEMQIIEADHMRVSLDMNFTMPGPFAGVKISIFKSQECEIFLDKEMDTNK